MTLALLIEVNRTRTAIVVVVVIIVVIDTMQHRALRESGRWAIDHDADNDSDDG